MRGPAYVLWPALAVVILGGCAVGPDYKRPAPFVSSTAGTNDSVWKPATPSAHLPRGAWWGIFRDPDLDRLERLAGTNNQDLAASMASLEQARALVAVSRSEFFPQVSANPGDNLQRTSANQFLQGRPAGTSYTYHTFTAPLEAGWELDLWGRIRRRVEGARARLSAAGDDLETLRLAIQSEIASDYFLVRTLDTEYHLLETMIDVFQRSLDLTRNRRLGGVASDLDVSQAETQVKTTEAQLPEVKLRRTQAMHALATLCGQAAFAFSLADSTEAVVDPPELPTALRSELLERRPDIAAAERRVAAANADVGVAQSAFYPHVQVNGLAGFQSISIGTLFNWPSRIWAVGPSLELPLFTGGRNRAQLTVARQAYEETVARYRQTVLGAFQEIEDQLAAQELLATEERAQEAALLSARKTLEVASNRYRAGLVTFLEVATAQSAALTEERTVVQLKAQRLAACVALIKAAGGSWQGSDSPVAANGIGATPVAASVAVR